MVSQKKLKAVIFDMDGVILDSERTLLDFWEILADELHLSGIRDVYISVCGTTHQATGDMMRQVYGEDFPFEEMDARVYRMRDEAYQDGLPLKTGIRELLEFLKEHEIRIALATSTRRKRAAEQLEAVELLSYFDIFISGDMVTRSKPDPEIFNLAIEHLGISPDEAIIIEDSFNGVRAGQKTGAEVIMVPDLKQPDQEISQLYDHNFPSLLEVRDYIASRI